MPRVLWSLTRALNARVVQWAFLPDLSICWDDLRDRRLRNETFGAGARPILVTT